MPRVSRQQTEANRIAIEQAAARLFRERGLAGVSVGEVMAAAGLTHGGFYGHFESKEALAAAACANAYGQSGRLWEHQLDGAAGLKTVADFYLHPRNRDDAGSGCPAVALAGDVAREPRGSPIREAYVAGLESLLAKLGRQQPHARGRSAREAALAQMSMLVGAVLLARATRGEALSDELLTAARRTLEAQADSAARGTSRRGRSAKP